MSSSYEQKNAGFPKKKVYSFIAPYGSKWATDEELCQEDFGFEPSICDLSDFVPLAELVRSFNPMDSKIEPEFEYPDGVESGEFDPPAEYDDVSDVYVAVQDKADEIKRTIAEKQKAAREAKVKEVPEVPEKVNADAPENKLEKAKEKATES